MKEMLLGFAGFLLLACNASAVEPVSADRLTTCRDYPWTALNIGVFPGFPAWSAETETRGLKLGLPICEGPAPVHGVEASVIWSGTQEVKGMQSSLLANTSRTVTGFQIAPINMSVCVFGVQIGVVNVAEERTFQIGLLNFIENGPIPFMPLINFNL